MRLTSIAIIGPLFLAVGIGGCAADRHLPSGTYFTPARDQMIRVQDAEIELRFRLAHEPDRYFDRACSNHDVSRDGKIIPYVMTSNQAWRFLQSYWYWDGEDIIRVDGLTWNIERFARDGGQSGTSGPDVVSIPGGPRFVRERDPSGIVCALSKYSADGTYNGSVFYDSSGSAVYGELYTDNVGDWKNILTKHYFYPNGILRLEERYHAIGVRTSRTDWDEQGDIVWRKRYGDPIEDFLVWLGWRSPEQEPPYPVLHLTDCRGDLR